MSVLTALLNLLYPQRCLCCRALTGTERLCSACSAKLVPLCTHEFKPRHADEAGTIFAAFSYTGTGARLMCEYKFYGKVRCYEPMRPVFEALVAKQLANTGITAVTCVPMHREALRKRGFNQGERIARSLAKHMALPYVALLNKQRKNKIQHELSAIERAENVKNVYVATKAAAGQTVLLVDDIATTGATLSACAAALRAAGAMHVQCVAVLAAPEYQT